MTTTPARHVTEPTGLVDGIRIAVTTHALGAEQLRAHVYRTDISRIGSAARRYDDRARRQDQHRSPTKEQQP